MIKPHPRLIDQYRPLAKMLTFMIMGSFDINTPQDLEDKDYHIDFYLKLILGPFTSFQYEIIDNLVLDYLYKEIKNSSPVLYKS